MIGADRAQATTARVLKRDGPSVTQTRRMHPSLEPSHLAAPRPPRRAPLRPRRRHPRLRRLRGQPPRAHPTGRPRRGPPRRAAHRRRQPHELRRRHPAGPRRAPARSLAATDGDRRGVPFRPGRTRRPPPRLHPRAARHRLGRGLAGRGRHRARCRRGGGPVPRGSDHPRPAALARAVEDRRRPPRAPHRCADRAGRARRCAAGRRQDGHREQAAAQHGPASAGGGRRRSSPSTYERWRASAATGPSTTRPYAGWRTR